MKSTPAEQEIASDSNCTLDFLHSKSHNMITIFVTVTKGAKSRALLLPFIIFIIYLYLYFRRILPVVPHLKVCLSEGLSGLAPMRGSLMND